MSDAKNPQSREERLAARLRENLHRRKAQARAMTHAGSETGESGTGHPPKSDLSKSEG
ncbi:MAG: hypothetical protein RIS94_1658 [Pseudomonadota bacterium]|jgi:hypothetical protein